MASEQEKAANNLIIAQQLQCVQQGQWRCCLNCTYWGSMMKTANGQGCTLFRELPPLIVLTAGCENWIYINDIPF